jgi:glucose-6-phosphate 1-dehydrogenase
VLKKEKQKILVTFGANGDLTFRYLLPALYRLFLSNHLPENFSFIGVSRTEYSDQAYRDNALAQMVELGTLKADASRWPEFATRVSYVPMDVKDPATFLLLKNKLAEKSEGYEGADIFYYLATISGLFATTLAGLKQNGMINPPESNFRTDVIVEKPIGSDLTSAKEINRSFKQYLAESQTYRIDHYLGKEAVQNILLFRFSNPIFESLWNRNYIDHIQISVAEALGAEAGGRQEYFDRSGALRDMLQNHLLQILSLVCLEPPVSLRDTHSLRNEKVKVLKSIKRLDEEAIREHVVRGQYVGGKVNNQEVPAYKNLPEVRTDSQTETYVAMRLEIDNWRWSGVPILLRTGKRLNRRITEVTVFFKQAPSSILQSLNTDQLKPNVLAMQLQPNEGISVQFNLKLPGINFEVKPVIMDFTYNKAFTGPNLDAYERLLLEVFRGDQTLFIRDDEVLEAWDLLDPLLKAWGEKNAPPLYPYVAGSAGPVEADRLTTDLICGWRKFD